MRARLSIPILVTILTAAIAAQALAADGAPTQTGPPDGTAYTAGQTITLEASVGITTPPTPDKMLFFVSRQADPIANPIDELQSGPPGGDASTARYAASPTDDKAWPQKPGVYHWQAAYQDCTAVGATPPNCYVTSAAPQTFTINAKPASAVNTSDDLNTFLNKHPKHRTHHRRVKFTFSANVKGATFQCLYADGWAKCDSPHVFRPLRPGHYQFKVRAKVKGVKDSSPATWTFRVLR
jgi:hypothetical protein